MSNIVREKEAISHTSIVIKGEVWRYVANEIWNIELMVNESVKFQLVLGESISDSKKLFISNQLKTWVDNDFNETPNKTLNYFSCLHGQKIFEFKEIGSEDNDNIVNELSNWIVTIIEAWEAK